MKSKACVSAPVSGAPYDPSDSVISTWPRRLWIVRHGESAGNVARDAAHRAGLERIDISERDVDVPLSERARSRPKPSAPGSPT